MMQSLSTPRFLRNPWLLGSGAIVLTLVTASLLHPLAVVPPKSDPNPAQIPENPRIAALGRIEPEADVLQIAPPSALENDRLLELRVKEGDSVMPGAILAVLDSRDRLQDSLRQAQTQVAIAEAALAQVQGGAKTGEINAQKAQIQRLKAQREGDIAVQRAAIAKLQAQWQGDRLAQQSTIRRLVAELDNSQLEYRRYKQLEAEGAIARSLLDSKGLALAVAQQQLKEAQTILRRLDATSDRQLRESQAALDRTQRTGRNDIDEAEATLDRIREVRPVDVQAAVAQLADSKAALKGAETALDKSYIRSPIAGKVLRIRSRAGEKPSDDGIIDIAQTDRMIIIAEVYQTDIATVKLGQRVTAIGQAFAGELQGEIYNIGQQVNAQTLTTNQPGENLDRRIIEVKVRLTPESRAKVAGLTYLQVQTIIQLTPQPPSAPRRSTLRP